METTGMFNRIIQSSISHRWMVMFAVAAMAVLGIYS